MTFVLGIWLLIGAQVCEVAEPAQASLPENLALQAAITADSEFNETYRAAHVANGAIPAAGSKNDAGQAWAVNGASHRHHAVLTMTWAEPVTVAEIVYYARTAFETVEGWRQYELYVDEAETPAAAGMFRRGHGPQRVRLDAPIRTQSLQLKFLNSYGGSNPGASEIQVFSTPAPDELLPPFISLEAGFPPEAIADPPGEPCPDALDTLRHICGFEALVLVQRRELNPSHVYTYHNEGFGAGGGLFRLNLADNELIPLVPSPEGQMLDCDVSWDGTQILFSWRRHAGEGYHVFLVHADGSGLRQITDGPWHDFNACWLPDGNIAFLSSRDARFAYCWNSPVATLHRMDADGQNVRRLSPNLVNDFTPSVMNDGRILYSRWEYVDKPAIPIQSLWAIHPDGTSLAGYFGNRVLSPATFMEARSIPNTTKIMTVMTAHNGPPRGAIGIIDRAHGVNAADAIRNITPEVAIGEVDKGSGNDVVGPYESPYPLDENWFLVSYRGTLYFRNVEGDCGAVVLQREGDLGFYAPRPLQPRTPPPVLPSGLPDEDTTGPWADIFMQDVYQGLEPHVVRGTVKEIAVVQELEKRVRISPEKRAFGFQFPVISGGATYAAKKVWGFAPVAEDGSARFLAPANVPVYFLALDEHGRAVQRMRTFTHFMPGERQSCIGCHESRSQTIQPVVRPDALRQQAATLIPPDWGLDSGFDYSAVVQPVLDRNCVPCHSGALPRGGLDLSGDKTDFFNVSYETLARENQGLAGSPYVNWIPTYNGHEANILEVTPLAWGSPRSKLADILLSGHLDDSNQPRIHLTAGEKRRILTWIDLNVPYYGTAETAYPEAEGSRRLYPEALESTLQQVAQNRCAACHENGDIPRREYVRITNPDLNSFLTAPLARRAGGSEICGPVFETTEDADYLAVLNTFSPVLEQLQHRPRLDMAGALPAPDVDRDRQGL